MESVAVQGEVPSGGGSPTSEELSDGIVRQVDEVDGEFATDRWAIGDARTDYVKWRLYDGAALRHCC